MCYPVSPLQVCCDGCGIAPLEIGVQPMQASPCVQGLRHFTLHTFAFSRFADMLFSPLSFGIRSASRPRRPFALNLLLLWSYLTSAEAAHAEPISSKLHQESFRANVVEEHHQLQLEEDHRIYGGATCTSIRLFDQVAHKREIYHPIITELRQLRRTPGHSGWFELKTFDKATIMMRDTPENRAALIDCSTASRS